MALQRGGGGGDCILELRLHLRDTVLGRGELRHHFRMVHRRIIGLHPSHPFLHRRGCACELLLGGLQIVAGLSLELLRIFCRHRIVCRDGVVNLGGEVSPLVHEGHAVVVHRGHGGEEVRFEFLEFGGFSAAGDQQGGPCNEKGEKVMLLHW